MLVLFRLDACSSVGAGHLMRCRALAFALRAHGVEAAFALGPESTEAALALADEGFGVESVPSMPSDLAATVAAASQRHAECILVDHYGAGMDYLEGLAQAGIAVGVIDDLADRDLSSARWILNQNLGAESLAYPVAAALGVRFALLRPEFAEARATLRRSYSERDARVLVTLGGGDTASLGQSAVDALKSVDVRVANGSIRSMAPLMAWADVSINAGGSTCWELACLGVPMVVTALSPDQEPNARALEAAGAAVAVDDLLDAAQIAETLLADPERRRAMSAAGMALVDGLGAARAAESLLSILEVARAAG